MAERILRSPGVTTRELDLSAPGRVRPQGIPAGIIGTSEKGPAFVPVTFATLNDFSNLFGPTKGKHFGAMAVNEWMRNARSGLYLRVLGAGDGNASSSTYPNQVTNAGFKVGQSMRDKDRTAASKALSTNPYAASETDGSGDNPVPNPYAGAAVTQKLTQGNVTHVRQILNVYGVVTITVTESTFSLDDYDGILISGADKDGNKFAWYLDGEASNTHTVASLEIKNAGGYVVHTLPAGTTGYIVDLTGDASKADIAASIRAATSGAGFGITGAGDAAVFTGAAYGAISNFTVSKVAGSTADLSLVTPVLTPAGSAAVAHTAYSQDLVFDENTLPAAGSKIKIHDGEGGSHEITLVAGATTTAGEIPLSTYDTPNKLVAALYDYLHGNAPGASYGVLNGIVNGGAVEAAQDMVATSNAGWPGGAHGMVSTKMAIRAFGPDTGTTGNQLKLVISQASGATGTIALGDGDSGLGTKVTEVRPAAGPGRLFFLGCESYAYGTANHPSDYLGSDDDTGNTAPILRGVLMFPSGVMPGIVGASNLSTDSIPASAFGEYGTGKDLGEADGKGKVHETSGEFRIVLNGFANTANYTSNKVLSGSFDTTSPIYFPKVFNTDPTKIQERGHYLYAHYDVPSALAQWMFGDENGYLKAGNYFNGFASNVHVSTGDYRPTFEDFQQRFQHAFSPWIMSQKLGNAAKKLFRFHALDAGSAGHGKIKISIANIAKSTDRSSDYGTFDVQIRDANDTDLKPIILQTFSGLSLNPSSD